MHDLPPAPADQALISPVENRRMFDTIARRYDLLNRIISLGRDHSWRRKAVDQLQVRRGGRYVDAGCGTGALSVEIAGRFPPGEVAVIGVDFSEAMLAEGARRVRRAASGGSVNLLRGDALALPCADGSLDGVISGFVLRNISDRPAALAEWFRVLRPGGRCVVLELAVPEKPAARWLYRVLTRLLVPAAARLLSRHKAYVYLLDSIQAFPPPETILALFCRAGFVNVRSLPLTFGAVRIYCGIKSLSKTHT
jgi:demethylmenaquinone methyltransferase/2-methoxy-6-polyprenyl-1,4-benzoquinol methylase